MIYGKQMLAAILDPFHRPTDFARGERNEKIFGVEFPAYAKAPTDVEFEHVDGALRQTKHLRQRAAIEEIDFGCTTDLQAPRCSIPFGDHAARFHRQRRVTMRTEFLFSCVFGRAKLSVDIANARLVTDGDIRAVFLEQ